MTDDDELTTEVLLDRAKAGDPEAEAGLVDRIYREVRDLARSRLSRNRGHTVQPTELVNEAFGRLLNTERRLGAEDRAHLISMVSQAMRHELVDRAKRRVVIKRGRGEPPVPLDSNALVDPDHRWRDEELLALDECLRQLGEIHPRWAQIVTHKFFGGLTWEQIAETLGVEKPGVVRREYDKARLWLFQTLGGTRQ